MKSPPVAERGLAATAVPRSLPAVKPGPDHAHVYRPFLDGLRAIAVLGVLVYHLDRTWLPGGYLGVDLFFVLSGYLITSLLIAEHVRTGRIDLPAFWARRIRRLLPALLVLLVVMAVVIQLRGDVLAEGAARGDLLATLFYVANWHFVASGQSYFSQYLSVSPDRHTWSLAVEEQFYLVWPIVTAAMVSWRWSRRFAIGIIAVAVAALTVRTAIQWKPDTNFFHINSIYVRTDTQAVELLAGAAAAYVRARYPLPRRTLHVLATVAAVFVAFCAWQLGVTEAFYYRGGLTLIAIAGSLVVLATVSGEWILGRALSWRPLRAIGRVSYGLYLWHLPIFFEVHRHAGSWPTALQVLLALGITSGATVGSWRFVEMPFLRRKATLVWAAPVGT